MHAADNCLQCATVLQDYLQALEQKDPSRIDNACKSAALQLAAKLKSADPHFAQKLSELKSTTLSEPAKLIIAHARELSDKKQSTPDQAFIPWIAQPLNEFKLLADQAQKEGFDQQKSAYSRLLQDVVDEIKKSDRDRMLEYFKQRATEIRAGLPDELKNWGNLGIAKVQINGFPIELKAHSSINYSTDYGSSGFVLLREQRIFPTKLVGKGNIINGESAYDRMWDTESKILEEVAYYLGENKQTTGRIDLFTERKPCASCSNIINQFKKKYSQVEVFVYDINR